MKIGELAAATGLTSKTIRFYEQGGLLPDPGRTASGYRAYRDGDVERLVFIRKAKRMGLSLAEIRGILTLHDRHEPTCVHVRSLLDTKLAQIDRLLGDLEQFRAELVGLRDRTGSEEDCGPSGGRICSIVEQSGLGVQKETLAWVDDRRNSRSLPGT